MSPKETPKRGRKPAYETNIKPQLDVVRLMAQNGVSKTKMREMLGVSRRTWERCLKEHSEFLDAVNTPRVVKVKNHDQDVAELEQKMDMLARGFTAKVKKWHKIKHVEYENGKRLSEDEEMVEVEEEQYFPPNFHALRFLLMNWGGYMSEPAAQAQREKEFEHKKAMDEKENW